MRSRAASLSSVTHTGRPAMTRGASRPAFVGGRVDRRDDVALERGRTGAPRERAVGHRARELEHPRRRARRARPASATSPAPSTMAAGGQRLAFDGDRLAAEQRHEHARGTRACAAPACRTSSPTCPRSRSGATARCRARAVRRPRRSSSAPDRPAPSGAADRWAPRRCRARCPGTSRPMTARSVSASWPKIWDTQ